MLEKFPFILILGLSLVAISCAQRIEAPALTAQDIQEITATVKASIAAVNAGNLDGWLATYTDDAVLMPPNEPAARGREAIRKWGETQLQMFTWNLTYTAEATGGLGDLAYQVGSLAFTITPKAEGQGVPLSDKGKTVVIFKKGPDGKWRAAVDTWNSDTPIPELTKAMQPPIAPTKPTS